MKSSFIGFLNLMAWGAVLLAFSHNFAWGDVLIDRVVAVVNREIITQSDLDQAELSFRKTEPDRRKGETDSDRAFYQRKLLSQLIEERLILHEAMRKGVRLSDSELELALRDIALRNQLPDKEALKRAVAQENISWDRYVADLMNQLIALKLINRETDTNVVVDDEEIQRYYNAHPERFQLPGRIRLKQILLRVSEGSTDRRVAQAQRKGEKVLLEAQGGEDFDRLVQRYSDGPEKREGGDLGFFKKGDLTPDIDRIVFKLKEGAISPIVRTPLGFHIFKVQERQEGRLRPLEIVRPEIKEILLSEKRGVLRKKWLDTLWDRSFVEVK